MSSPTIGVQSIRRAFAVLRALADGPLGVTEVAVAVPHPEIDGRPPPRRPRRGGRRRAGPGRASLPARAAPAWPSRRARRRVGHRRDRPAGPRRPRARARRGRRACRSATAGPSTTSTRSSRRTPVQVRDWTGTRIPLHAVSSGQVFLAQLPAPVLARYLAEPLEAFTPRTLTDAASLLERLREVRRDGHAWVRDEYAIGISSVAAPIADARGEIVAAVHVHGPRIASRQPARRTDRASVRPPRLHWRSAARGGHARPRPARTTGRP